VSLRHPNGLGQPLLLEAQIDTGANRTVVPMSVAVRLGLDRVTQLQFVVVGGVITLPVY
jgi:predicted aspartyl protease